MLLLVKNRILISIFFYLLWGASFFTNILELEETTSEVIIWTCNAVLFIFWLFILVDMIRTKIKDKTFWILSMIFLPFFAPVVYLFRRKNLIHLESNKFKSARKFD